MDKKRKIVLTKHFDGLLAQIYFFTLPRKIRLLFDVKQLLQMFVHHKQLIRKH